VLHVAAITAAAALTTCAKRPPLEIPQPIGQTHTLSAPFASASEPQRRPFETVRVSITSRLREACHMPDAPRAASEFELAALPNATGLKPIGEDVLHVVGLCLATPSLEKGRLCISGFADPHDTTTLEEDLGRAHARAAKHYLETLGVAASRMDLAVRRDLQGEPGSLERVEVDLQDSVECPGRF
jgi:hypothetical protein